MAPVTGSTIEAVEQVFARLGPSATIDRQPAARGEAVLWTIHTRQAGAAGIGQGATLVEALQDLHVVKAAA